MEETGTVSGLKGTYSPDDNKLRLEAARRLDAPTYARNKAAGFRWAPAQQLFVAPMWRPDRADLVMELCGDIEGDDTSLVEQSENRADRFETTAPTVRRRATTHAGTTGRSDMVGRAPHVRGPRWTDRASDGRLVERSEDRAERFGDCGANRAKDADSAERAVRAITDHIPMGELCTAR